MNVNLYTMLRHSILPKIFTIVRKRIITNRISKLNFEKFNQISRYSSSSSVEGKNCIVTGASGGIGLYTVRELLQNGANKICMLDINDKKGQEESAKLNKEMGRECCIFQKVDAGNTKELELAFRSSVCAMKTVDIIINNAGVLNDAKWEKEVDVNIKGVILGTLLGFLYMGRDNGGKGGVVINVASILGTQPLAGAPVYVGTKHAIVGMTRSWGMPFYYDRTGVKVLAMCPGVTETAMVTEAKKNQINPLVGKECERELGCMPGQSAEHVGREMISLIGKKESGGIWICEGCEPIYRIEIPDRLKLPRKD